MTLSVSHMYLSSFFFFYYWWLYNLLIEKKEKTQTNEQLLHFQIVSGRVLFDAAHSENHLRVHGPPGGAGSADIQRFSQ